MFCIHVIKPFAFKADHRIWIRCLQSSRIVIFVTQWTLFIFISFLCCTDPRSQKLAKLGPMQFILQSVANWKLGIRIFYKVYKSSLNIEFPVFAQVFSHSNRRFRVVFEVCLFAVACIFKLGYSKPVNLAAGNIRILTLAISTSKHFQRNLIF